MAETIIDGTAGNDTLSGGNGKNTIHGLGGDDILYGGNGIDHLYGDEGNDQLFGGNGTDYLIGGAGDDVIDGIGGADIAYYSGAIDEYSFFTSGGYLHIVHLGGAGADGHDRVKNVEQLVFADRVIDIGSGKNAPVAGDDQVFIDEDAGVYSSGAAKVTDNDYDFDGDPLTVTGGTFTGTYGTLTLNSNGTYSYALFASEQALAQGENVTDSFNYTVTDNDGSDTGTLVFDIAGVNDAPTANPDTATTGENDVVVVDVLANDSDVDHGAVLSVTAASAPSGQGTASVVGNQVQWDPGTDFDYLAEGESATVTVDYTIGDEHGAQSTSTITVTVEGHDDPGIVIIGTPGDDALIGTPGDDTIDALGGDDTVFGQGGADLIFGGDGADALFGEAGNDVVDGGNGDDFLSGGDGNDQLAGGAGNDSLDGGAGDDSLDGGADDDTLSDFAGINSFTGGLGNDLIVAGSADGAQTIDGGGGNDTIRLYYRGYASTITTGSGSDTVELAQADQGTAAITVTDFTPGAGGDMFLLASDNGSLLSLLSGWDGTSNPFGSSGFLRLEQSGADTLLQWDQDGTAGGSNWETLAVFQNTDAGDFTGANFAPGYDPDGSAPAGQTIIGTAGDDTLTGTVGGDTIDALGGADYVFGGAGDDVIHGGDGADNLSGEAGNDVIEGGNDDDSVSGGDGNDQLFGQAGNDILFGDNGNDQVSGGDGDDQLFDGAGDDALDGGAGNDFLAGFSGVNSLVGGLGNDLIVADSTGGIQTIDGGDDNDTILHYYRYSASTITTGSGSDTIELAYADQGAAAITVTDFTAGAGGDIVQLSDVDGSLLSLLDGWDGSSNPFASDFLRLEQNGADTVLQWDQDGATGGANWETLLVFQNTDASQFTAANFGPGYDPGGSAPAGETITGTADDDVLIGTIGGDTIDALGGQDAVFGQAGADIIYGGDGLDNLYGGADDDTIDGGNGDDSISGDEGNDQLFGQAGDDIVFGGDGNDQISGGDGFDNLNGEAGNDTIQGGNDDDFLSGGDGDDTLDGGDGADFLSGGGGSDTLTGGIGADVFAFASPLDGPDQVVDFVSGSDRIQISSSGFGDSLVPDQEVLLVSGSNPTVEGSDGQFLFNTDDGNLFWDDDGTGSDAAALIATFSNIPSLTATDFIVV